MTLDQPEQEQPPQNMPPSLLDEPPMPQVSESPTRRSRLPKWLHNNPAAYAIVGSLRGMFPIRVPLVSILALTLTTLACSLPLSSVGPTPTAPVIEVTATPVIRPMPTEAAAPSTSVVTTPAPATLSPDCTLDSDFVSDVTIPDRSLIEANSVFVKTWQLRNSGDCPWNSAFQFVQIGGGMLSATPNSIALPDVPVGGEVDISMTLTLSSAAPVGSEQTARFQIRAPDGSLFGTKPFVKVLVVAGSD